MLGHSDTENTDRHFLFLDAHIGETNTEDELPTPGNLSDIPRA